MISMIKVKTTKDLKIEIYDGLYEIIYMYIYIYIYIYIYSAK